MSNHTEGTIAVVGGGGYIGSFTARALMNMGKKTIVIDNFSTGHREACKGIRIVEADILKDNLVDIFKKEHVTDVIHFAALIQANESMQKPAAYFKNNILGTLRLLDSCVQAGVSSFVFSSTAAVYGDPIQIPIPETHRLLPKNVYGESKVCAEKLMYWYWTIYRLPSVAIRYFNAAGADLKGRYGEDHKNESHLIPNIIKSILADGEVVIFGNDYSTPDGTCIRDYIHVLDLADVHIKALQYLRNRKGNFVFNAGTGKGYSNLEVVKMVEEVSGQKVHYKIGQRRPGDVASLVADSSLARKELGWQPRYSSLRMIIETSFLWHQNHPEGYRH